MFALHISFKHILISQIGHCLGIAESGNLNFDRCHFLLKDVQMKFTTVTRYINVCIVDRITSCYITEYMYVFYKTKILCFASKFLYI